jgi:hypothetical protein
LVIGAAADAAAHLHIFFHKRGYLPSFLLSSLYNIKIVM